MDHTKERQGEFFILAEAFFWSLFPVMVILSLKNLPALLSLAWSTFFAAIFFAFILSVRKKWPDVRNKEALREIILTTLILVTYYLLFFTGLKYTSAGNASIVALMEIFFSFLFFNIWKKEYMPRIHIYGAIFMVLGAIIILSSNFETFHLGDILIFSASAITPLGNYFQRGARKKVSSESILFARSIISFPIVFLLAHILGNEIMFLPQTKTLLYLMVIGFFIFGFSKIFWLEGIHRINVAKAHALSSASPLLTLFFAWIILGDLPTKFQLISFIPMFLGVLLLSRKEKK